MQQRTNVNLLFYIRLSRKKSDGTCSIIMRITAKGKRTEFHTEQSILPQEWDSVRGAAFGFSKKARIINGFLDALRIQVAEIITCLKEDKTEVSADNIRTLLSGGKIDRHYLMETFGEHNMQMKTLIGSEYTHATYRKYLYSYSHTKDFLNEVLSLEDIEFSEIDFKFLTDYEYYLKSKRNCSHNTSVRYIKQLKKIVNIALNNDWIKENPFRKYKSGYKRVDKDFLSEEELDRLINKEFSITRIEQVRDCFLFSCFTGLAHIDLHNLTKENIVIGGNGKKWLSINRQKTNTSSKIPLLPITINIIEKYKNHPGCIEKGLLLPVYSNQKMNCYLKEIADLCEINKNLTSHVARHTFATTVTLNNDVPIESVSKMLGHTKLETTKIYARLLDKKVGQDMDKLFEKYA